MTAEPTGHVMWTPDPIKQRAAVYTLEDVLSLPDDAPRVEAEVSGSNHYTLARQVTLVVEVVSPGTRKRDRLEKPAEYAAARIPHYWRVEQDPLHVFAYDLVDDRYQLAAHSAEELVLEKPFPIRLPIADIAP